MGAQYYYFLSSLPMLKWGEAPVVGSAEFLEQAERHLDAVRWQELTALGLLPNPCPSSKAETVWADVETYIRNGLAQVRAAHAGTDKGQWLRPERDVFPGLRVQVDEAVAAPDPLVRERMLDEIRWQALSDAEAGHEFDYAAVVIYRLKLLLAEKWIDREAGAGVERLAGLAAQVRTEVD